jgi:hypothetical protein
MASEQPKMTDSGTRMALGDSSGEFSPVLPVEAITRLQNAPVRYALVLAITALRVPTRRHPELEWGTVLYLGGLRYFFDQVMVLFGAKTEAVH